MEFPGQGSLDLLVTAASERAGQVRLGRSLDAAAKPRSDQSPSDQAALEKSAKEFEGVFLNTLLKAMRKTVPENELF
jgi:Rod binding domain-containing protein